MNKYNNILQIASHIYIYTFLNVYKIFQNDEK